ncbi:PmbA protein [Desulfonispora thiosulfatigenes DSM 11270]|uniref:PmbA protein n=1 Tax=Desulfonispora thiosulfatigenes DSM 11270 TaxID=656914 RepID=A0A1W1VPB3_DESTI|nr:TldD/PmbA family protein [Desulfonispora thiosulfatigenes]SMB94764.1 PmbA protein [Desulfonispora thiosulfatigenes DSM 11270]
MHKNDFLNLGNSIVQKALKHGADFAEVFISRSKDLNIMVSNQEINNIKEAEERGLGLRVFKNNCLGFAYTSDLNSTSLDRTILNAIANAGKTEKDEFLTLAPKYDSYANLNLYDEKIFNRSIDEKIDIAKEIESFSKKYDKRIKLTERSSYEDSLYEICIINSLGLEAYYEGSYCGGYALVVGEEKGESQTGFGMKYSLNYEDLDPKKIGEEAAMRAVRLLGAQTMKSQNASLVLEPYMATNFLGIIAPAFLADYVHKGKSFLENKLNTKIASELISIIDDGSLPGKIVSSPFDSEGVPTSETILVKDGNLTGYLHNLYTAKKEGIKSTGNASRGSYRGSPEVGTTNFYIGAGKTPVKELIKNTDKGLFVTDVMGMHTANPITGDFSLGASGIWIEKGEFIKPVRGIAIAGNLKDLLLNVSDVGSDLTFFVGKGSPTLKINNISISGS